METLYKAYKMIKITIPIIVSILIAGCVINPPKIVKLNSDVKYISIDVKNDTLNFKDKLFTKIGTDRIVQNSSNKLSLNVTKNEMKYHKYKEKNWYTDGFVYYKFCYVDTHYFDIEMNYTVDTKTLYNDTISTINIDDSCYEERLLDHKGYTVDETIDNILKTINKEQ